MDEPEHLERSGHLDVTDGHAIWWAEFVADGPALRGGADIPVLCLHGGPGGATSVGDLRTAFAGTGRRLIVFDQRGCGRSRPNPSQDSFDRCLAGNTTNDLVDDAARVLASLGVNRVDLYGRSWGSTLAVLVAARFPDLIRRAIFASIFLGSWDIDWVDRGKFATMRPHVWEYWQSVVPADHRSDPVAHLHATVLDESAEESRRLEALQALVAGESAIGAASIGPIETEMVDIAGHLVYSHYMMERCFEPGIVEAAATLSVPASILHGAHDCLCPPSAAVELANAIPTDLLSLYWYEGSHALSVDGARWLRHLVSNV